MGLDNDTRGWIMTSVSGVACVAGASIICIDLIIQRIPGKQNFKIQDSNTFLAASLSLSFGVMLFSSLNNMLPEAQEYLNKGGLSKAAAAWITITCFLGGVVGIQFVSRILHHFIPSHIVDCDHTHDEDKDEEHDHDHRDDEPAAKPNGSMAGNAPLLSKTKSQPEEATGDCLNSAGRGMQRLSNAPKTREPPLRRPSIPPKLASRVGTFMAGAKVSCEEGGPCYGYGDPCGTECLKIGNRSPTRTFGRVANAGLSRQPSLLQTTTTPRLRPRPTHSQTADVETGRLVHLAEQSADIGYGTLRGRQRELDVVNSQPIIEHPTDEQTQHHERAGSEYSLSESSTANEATHHHHVPRNAFLAIGLQTSIAIALHKLPEGFITYATNHANPNLGFSVFMALFIHNITEGFAMALPLYLAINNRFQAMLWSSLLGGVSQPLGAGIAALWFTLAASGELKPGDTVYGCMFSITAGIMASVALQLSSESLMLTHNRHICTAFAFIGMGILGVSHALTAR